MGQFDIDAGALLSLFSGTGFQPVKPTGWKPVPLWLPHEGSRIEDSSRDYRATHGVSLLWYAKNVHHDLQVLERAGLVMRSPDGRLRAPWTKIIAEIALAA